MAEGRAQLEHPSRLGPPLEARDRGVGVTARAKQFEPHDGAVAEPQRQSIAAETAAAVTHGHFVAVRQVTSDLLRQSVGLDMTPRRPMDCSTSFLLPTSIEPKVERII